MCGIAGFLGPERLFGAAEEASVASAIRYRGRDAEGAWRDHGVALLHSRLAVVDLEHGGQPMADSSGRYVIVFGGEVHNFEELRDVYEQEGGRFRTTCDTEVVLEGFRLRGPGVCDDLIGMYAFAIWDRDQHELFLARDRLGEKPLVWFTSGEGLWFASTCAAFEGLPGWHGGLSERGLAEFAAVGSFRDDTTIFEQAVSLPPGTWAIVRPGDRTVRPQRYWSIDLHAALGRSEADYEAEYEALLCDVVRLRLRADVPIVVTFSGGVDSGSIAAVAATTLGSPVSCLTLDYDTPDAPSEEVGRARAAAAQLGVPWSFEHYDYRTSFADDLVEAYRWFDQPTSQPEIAQIGRIAGLIRHHATVAVTGSGGDELFLGYIGDERLRRLDLVSRAAPFAGRLSDPVWQLGHRLRGAAAAAGFVPDLEALEPSLDALADAAADAGVRRATQLKLFHSLTWGAADANYRVPDISGLTAQVEFRSPFLDHRMVELASRLPDRMKARHLRHPRGNKWIAKRLYERKVGPELAWAPKLNNGGNLRWDIDLGREPRCLALVDRGLSGLDAAGLESAPARAAWTRYRADVAAGRDPSTWRPAFRSLMLGLWLTLRS